MWRNKLLEHHHWSSVHANLTVCEDALATPHACSLEMGATALMRAEAYRTWFSQGEAFATRDAARVAIVSYIEGFCNRKRLHQTLDYRTPAVVDDEAMSA